MPAKGPELRQTDERKQAKIELLMKGIDKRLRTRAGAKKVLENMTDEQLKKMMDALQDNKQPTKLQNGKKIFSGTRPGFDKNQEAAFWKKNANVPCAICKKPIDLKATGRDHPSIDHKDDWASLKTQLETVTVCTGKTHWEVVLHEDAAEAYNDQKNLRPAHQGCNSEKSGSKSTDAINPKRLGICPGDGACDVQDKAS